MGFTSVKVRIVNPGRREHARDIELLVDTGALYTLVFRGYLEEVGIKPLGRRRFKTADGRIIERDVGEVLMVLMGEERHVPVAFGEEKDAMVLGVTVLEIFGLEVDPNTKELKPATLPLY